MKICMALTVALLAESRGVKNSGHGVPVAHEVPVSHAAVGAGESHVTVAAVANGQKADGGAGHVAAGRGKIHDTVDLAASSHKTEAGTGKIVPPLVDVDTDKKFFGPPFPADYPDDISPPAEKTLFKKGWVYPKVQDEGFFDKDFVKDENSDGGKWQAQSDYDAARTKVWNEKRQAENAKKRVENEAHDVENAANKVKDSQHKEDDAAKKAKTQEEAAKSAAERAKEQEEKRAAEKAAHAQRVENAEERRRRQEEEAHNKGTELENKLAAADDALEQERESYKNCLKDLDAAKDKVKKLEVLRDQLKNGEVSPHTRAEPNLESEKMAVDEAKKDYTAAEAKQQEAEHTLKAAHEAKEAAQRDLEKEKADNAKAEAAVEEEEKRVEEAEKELASSRQTLRRIRGLEAVPGATPAPKAGAAGMTLSLTVAIVWITTLTF